MELPQRPGPYVLTLLLLVLIALVVYIAQMLDSPSLRRAIEQAKAKQAHSER